MLVAITSNHTHVAAEAQSSLSASRTIVGSVPWNQILPGGQEARFDAGLHEVRVLAMALATRRKLDRCHDTPTTRSSQVVPDDNNKGSNVADQHLIHGLFGSFVARAQIRFIIR